MATNNYNTIIGSPITPNTAATTASTSSIVPPPTINIEDFQLFPLVLDIISRIKDDEIDLIRAINLANDTRVKTLETLSKLPGINRSLEEQEKLLKSYKLTLKKKEELLEKLKKLEIFQKYNQIKSTIKQTDTNDNDNNNNNNNSNSSNNNDDDSSTNTDNTTTITTTTTAEATTANTESENLMDPETLKTDDDIMKE